jgi:hypothetical protein
LAGTRSSLERNADDGRIAKQLDGLIELVPGAVSTFPDPILAGIGGPVNKYVDVK